MDQKIDNRLKECDLQGDYVGGNQTNNYYISMLQDSEREFVVTHNANIKPVAYFTGRETELKALRQGMEKGRKCVLVSGMGGIGKTHICRKLFEEYSIKHGKGENEPFHHIGYIEYNGDMGSSLQNCLKFKQQENQEQNQEAAWRELEYLASDGKLLLFVDNVNEPMHNDPGLQRLKGVPGAIILTSRQASICDEFEPYPIGFLNMEQCKEIYEKIRFRESNRKIDPEEVFDFEYVIEKLAGKHTITVEHLAHLAWTKRWSVRKLREKLEEKGFCLEFHKNGEIVNIQKSYEKLYDLSELTKSEQNVLEAFSVFPYIPLEAETCNQWLFEDAEASEDDDILMELYEKGWLQFDIEQESYTLHPVFAQFIYERNRPTFEKHAGLIKACKRDLEIPENGSPLECQQYIPFAESIIEKINLVDGLEQVKIIDTLAYLLYYIAEYEKAQVLYRKVFTEYEKVLGESHPDTATSYNNLARVYEKQGKYREAEGLYKKALAINKKVQGEEHPSTATNYNNLAGVYEKQGKYKKAEGLYKKALAINKKVWGEEDLKTAINYNNLAGVYERQREHRKAKELYKKALVINKRALGEEHPDIATSYNNLAGVYMSLGEYGKAERLYNEAIAIIEKALGTAHQNIAVVYNNLAEVHMSLGEYGKAERLYKEALAIIERVLGKEHPLTATNYNNLGSLYKSQRRYEISVNYYHMAYNVFLHRLGTAHPNTKTVLKNMRNVYYEGNPEGDFEKWLEGKGD